MTYAIQLGREPLLSVLELEAVLSTQGFKADIQTFGSDIALVELDDFPEAIFNTLGGSIKLGKLINRFPADAFLQDPIPILTDDDFLAIAIGKETSVSFAISAFGSIPSGFCERMKRIALEWKKQLRQRYAHVRYVESKDQTTSSVTVARNKLLRGCDLWILFAGQDVLLVKTLAVQDYRSFSERDFGRPMRNARNGMLPPKLARMMVNLSGAHKDSVVHDPFVGSGTILQEAVLLGVEQVIGTDIEERNIADTQANLDWLAERTDKKWTTRLECGDILRLRAQDFKEVTHVVCEIDLGNPLLEEAGERQAKEDADNATALVEATLAFAVKIRTCETVVIAIPFWKHQKRSATRVQFDVPKEFVQAKDAIQATAFPHEISSRGGLDYSRPDQFVGREIFVFKKK